MSRPTPNAERNTTPQLQQALVDQPTQNGSIPPPNVEAAFRAVPRHLFLPEVPAEPVYQDQAIPTKVKDGIATSSSSQPAIMAVMLGQLGLQPGHRVLEIGAGTGYNAALMAHIVGESGSVVTIDIDADVAARARQQVATAGCRNITVVCGDGGAGYPGGAPYDRILLSVGAWDIAPAWSAQLHPRGRLVLPLSLKDPQRSVAFEPTDGGLVSVSVADCFFMRLRGAWAGPERQVALGPDPGLYLTFDDQRSVDAEAIYQGLMHASRAVPTTLHVAPRDLYRGLILWLALQAPDFCRLFAVGDMMKRDLISDLFGFGRGGKFAATVGVQAGASLCVLMRPPERPVEPSRFGCGCGALVRMRPWHRA